MTDNEESPPTITAIDVYHKRRQEQLEAGRKAVERQRPSVRMGRSSLLSFPKTVSLPCCLGSSAFDERG
jgi:hypothetical protein